MLTPNWHHSPPTIWPKSCLGKGECLKPH
jgi:hypothetical protein